MTKIVILCQVFVSEYMIYRWQKMVQDFSDVEITLIGPTEYICADWGGPINLALSAIEQERFRFIPLRFVCNRVLNRVFQSGVKVPGLENILKAIKPDLIYLIGTEISDVTFQVALARKFFLPKSKLALFTMRGLDMPLHNPVFRIRWRLLRSVVDAFFCHYPHCVEVLRTQGRVTQPIYMQTQVGVNTDIFKPDIEKRQRIREKLGVKDDEYLFGSLSRMDLRKGLLDMVDALPVKAKWKFAMMGSGTDQKAVEEAVRAKGLTGKVLFPGMIDLPYGVAEYINALDCSVLMSKTSSSYIDTFALAVAQSMAIGLPVIVSDSGGLPYQVGKEGIVVHEGDVDGLHKAMEYVSSNPEEGRTIGAKMMRRLLVSFSVPHLNHCFYVSAQDIINGLTNKKHFDQQDFTFVE